MPLKRLRINKSDEGMRLHAHVYKNFIVDRGMCVISQLAVIASVGPLPLLPVPLLFSPTSNKWSFE